MTDRVQLPRVVVLFSGRGSNMSRLIDAASGYTVVLALSNKADAQGLIEAQKRGVRALAFPRASYSTVAEQQRAIFEEVLKLEPDIVALAGYMRIIEPYFVDRFYGRLVNIHPALLPAFPGLDTHKRAIEAKVSDHGCTVHFVDSGVDTGPIIAQARVAVLFDDLEEALAERVLAREHQIYPWVIAKLANGDIKLDDGKVLYSDCAFNEAKTMNFTLSATGD